VEIKKKKKHLVCGTLLGENALLMLEVRGAIQQKTPPQEKEATICRSSPKLDS